MTFYFIKPQRPPNFGLLCKYLILQISHIYTNKIIYTGKSEFYIMS